MAVYCSSIISGLIDCSKCEIRCGPGNFTVFSFILPILCSILWFRSINQSPFSSLEAFPTAEIPETIPVASSTDWQAAFGFTSSATTTIPTVVAPSADSHIDDDLGRNLLFSESKVL